MTGICVEESNDDRFIVSELLIVVWVVVVEVEERRIPEMGGAFEPMVNGALEDKPTPVSLEPIPKSPNAEPFIVVRPVPMPMPIAMLPALPLPLPTVPRLFSLPPTDTAADENDGGLPVRDNEGSRDEALNDSPAPKLLLRIVPVPVPPDVFPKVMALLLLLPLVLFAPNMADPLAVPQMMQTTFRPKLWAAQLGRGQIQSPGLNVVGGMLGTLLLVLVGSAGRVLLVNGVGRKHWLTNC
jgi:hypothetical protein